MVRLSWYHGLVLHVFRSNSALTAGGVSRITNARVEDVEHALCDLVAAGKLTIAPGFSMLRCYVATPDASQTDSRPLQASHRRPSGQSEKRRRKHPPSALQRKVDRRKHKNVVKHVAEPHLLRRRHYAMGNGKRRHGSVCF